jgi:hypothetical protein
MDPFFLNNYFNRMNKPSVKVKLSNLHIYQHTEIILMIYSETQGKDLMVVKMFNLHIYQHRNYFDDLFSSPMESFDGSLFFFC